VRFLLNILETIQRKGSAHTNLNPCLKEGGRNRFFVGQAILIVVLILSLAMVASGAEHITNTAKVTYDDGSSSMVLTSNTVSTLRCTDSKLQFLKYAPSANDAKSITISTTMYINDSGEYSSMPNPVPLGSTSPLDISNPIPLIEANVYHKGEPLFLILTDNDQNINQNVREIILLNIESAKSGDKEIILLIETGPDTGIFTGYIQSAATSAIKQNGIFNTLENDNIVASYEDKCGQSDTGRTNLVTAVALVDPFGVVFDTATGQPVNGASVTLIDAETGIPATIYGDDGVSIYPSTVTTGGTATDSSGTVYSFPAGGYRFPFILPGKYRLQVVPPVAYRAPSTVPTEDIQRLPGAPFAIVLGSKGEDFYVNPGPAINIDIPVDPILTGLYVTKGASKSSVSIGDFLQYRITVENTGAVDLTAVTVNDILPLGFRYRKGSTRINGVVSPDPTISTDGRSLAFGLGSLLVGKKATITYVVEIAAGAKIGKAINLASAKDSGGATSNTARAEVLVKEDLFRSKTFIIGRVVNGCEGEGVAGVRIYLEDGTYVITDNKGMYHFEGIKPGTHVVQIDMETIPDNYELISCKDNDRFAGTLFSQFVDLQGGSMWRADFHLAEKPKPVVEKSQPVETELTGSVGIDLSSILQSSEVEYEVALHVTELPADNLRLTVILPEGVIYQKGSSKLENTALPDPDIMDDVLIWRIGNVREGWNGSLKFKAVVPIDGNSGELVTKAFLTFDSLGTKNLRTPLVDNIIRRNIKTTPIVNPDITLRPHFEEFGTELTKEDKAMLDQIIENLKKMSVKHMFVIGHTDSTRIAPRSRHIYADNYALSRARAESVGSYIAKGLGLLPSQITMEGKGPDEPIASNKTADGRALNRRVELRIISETAIQRPELQNIKDRSGVMDVEVRGVKPIEEPIEKKQQEEKIKSKTMPEFDDAWLDKADPGLAFVWPYDNFHPPIPSVKIAIKHDPSKKLKLFMNGQEVDPIYLDGTKKSNDNRVAISLWIGISVQEGDNLFEAIEYGQDGNKENWISRIIHYSSPPVKAELVPEKSILIADGKTPPIVAVRLIDKDGHPAREGLVGEYKVDPPYRSFQKFEDLQSDPLGMSKSEELKYEIGEDGIVFIKLQPTSQIGEVILRFNLVSGENTVRTWLTPGERDWILVGLAEGTAGYNIISGNMESLGASGEDDKYYDNGRVAFFAKGMIKGKWLLTIAYDSDKKGINKNDSLHGIIDPDKYYTLYGDATQQGYEAASARSLYLKIERDKFYALFGDFETGFNVTELSKYSRNLNGFKSEMKGEKIDFKVFVSDTNQAFVKDEIRGDGTSGLYKLSRKNIVINSETVTIETRDRFKSEEIISSVTLSRHIDYNIDYDAGTIYFKSPVNSRDENFNPIYIVVTYESFDPSDMSYNYGGRGAVRFMDNKLEIGATHIHEGRIGGDGNLTGIDTNLKLNDKTTVRAEFAQTDTDFNNVSSSGNAYLAEVSHRSEKLDGKVYVREQESGFGLGQQNGSESGTRKIGLAGAYRLDEKISINTDVFRQYNLGTNAVRDMAQAQAKYNENKYEVHGGFRHAEDKFDNGDVNNSEQIIAGGSYRMLNDRIVLRLDHNQSIFGSNENADYPTRTIIGADYNLNKTATLFAAQEFTQGENADTETTRIGIKSSPWTGGEIGSTVEQQYTENGARVFSVIGLKQAWQVSKKLSIDTSLDRSKTLKHQDNSQFNTNVPASSGGTDFTAVSVGSTYRAEKWSWTGRLEIRDSKTEEKFGIFTGIYGEVREGMGLAVSMQAFKTESSPGADRTTGNLRFSLAYRPKQTKWIVLDRLDYIFDKQKGSTFDYTNWRIINNMNANYKFSLTQISLQYGSKYVNETIDSTDYSGYTDLTGLEGRYDITEKWDIGIRGSVLHSWNAEQYKYGYGLSIGYSLAKNIWLSVGYNIAGFRDRDFSRIDFTAEGPFVKFRMKFDQENVKEAAKWFIGH